MKLTIIALAVLASSTVTVAQTTPPSAVKASFEKRFTGSNKIKWIKEKSGEFEAEFTINDKKCSANFLPDGSWKETESQISVNEVPSAVMNAFKGKHGNAPIKLVAKIERSSAGTEYEIEYKDAAKTKEAIYDDKGNLTKG